MGVWDEQRRVVHIEQDGHVGAEPDESEGRYQVARSHSRASGLS
jgi:hypothetical protein